MPARPRAAPSRTFNQRVEAVARRLGIDPSSPDAFPRLGMALLMEQPEFRSRKRPRKHTGSRIDEASLDLAEAITVYLRAIGEAGTDFDGALRTVVKWLEQGSALVRRDRNTNSRRVGRGEQRPERKKHPSGEAVERPPEEPSPQPDERAAPPHRSRNNKSLH